MYANSLSDDLIYTYFFRKKDGGIYAASDFNTLNVLKRILFLSIQSEIDCVLPTVVAGENILDATRQSVLTLIGNKVCHDACEPAQQIIFDGRTRKLENTLKARQVWGSAEQKFFWIKCSDFPVFVIVCVLDAKEHSVSASGVSFRLVDALSEAYLNAVTAFKVKKLNRLYARFLDIDNNADESYAMEKFQIGNSLLAGRLPDDFVGSVSEELRLIQRAFKKSRQQLRLMNLTTPAQQQTGYFVVAADA